jgi:hypothetical protein
VYRFPLFAKIYILIMLENTKRNVIGGVGDDFGLRAIL